MKDILMVEKDIDTIGTHHMNAIPIIAYDGDQHDHELVKLANYLWKLGKSSSAVEENVLQFKFHRIQEFPNHKLFLNYILTGNKTMN